MYLESKVNEFRLIKKPAKKFELNSIDYKSKLGREVDLIDVKEMQEAKKQILESVEYFEKNDFGNKTRVAVECKEYSRVLTQEQVSIISSNFKS